MEKVFIGKVTEKVFDNGGSVIKFSLSPDDKEKLKGDGWTNIDIKKSTKGNWYAEISQFQPQAQSAAPAGKAYQKPSGPANLYVKNSDISPEPVDDLPF